MRKFINSIFGRGKQETEVTAVDQSEPTQWQKVEPPPEVKATMTTPTVKEPEISETPTQPISLQKFRKREEPFPLDQNERLQKMVELYLQRILNARQRGIDNIALKARKRLEQLINNHLAASTQPKEGERAAIFIYELLKKQNNATIKDDINVVLDFPRICEARIRDLAEMLKKHKPIVSKVDLLAELREIYADYKDEDEPHELNSRMDSVEKELNEAKVANEDIIDDKVIRLNKAIKKYGYPSEDFQYQFSKISNAEKRKDSDIRVNLRLDKLLDEMKTYKEELDNPLDYNALLEEAKKAQQEATKPSGIRSWQSSKATSETPAEDDKPRQGPGSSKK